MVMQILAFSQASGEDASPFEVNLAVAVDWLRVASWSCLI